MSILVRKMEIERSDSRLMDKPINDQGPLFCPHCGKHASLQLIYSIPQVAHLLKKSRGQVQNMLREGKLKFRYELRTGWCARRVVDYFQLWNYIDKYLPKPKDILSDDLSPTLRAIKRILEWERHGQTRAKATRERKKVDGAENPS